MRERSLAEVTQRLELALRVVNAAYQGILVGGTAPCLVDVLTHDIVEVDEGVLPHARHEGVSRALDG